MKKFFIAGLFVLTGQLALAQASLEITLLDSSKAPVSFHPVEIINPSIGFSQQALSTVNGKVRLDGLSTSGTYSVVPAESDFYNAAAIQGISLTSDKTTSITLTMGQKTVALEGVTVVADAYQTINATDAEVASELTAREIQQLPVEGRDITRTLYRLPNITQATGFFPEAPNVAINGANALYTNYQIDGLENNENFLGGQRFNIPIGFTKNITALTNNFSAEHGLTSNGIINITTKSGTNDLSGEAFYVVRPGPPLDASSPFAQRDLSGNQVKDGFQRHQVGFGVGGPIIKDKTFYFVNVEHTTDLKDNLLNVPELGINETVEGTNRFTYLSGKIDHYWSKKFRSSLRVNRGIVNIERQGGGLEGGVTFPSAGNQQDRLSWNVALKNTYNSENFTYEANYQYGTFSWNYANPENNDSPDVTVIGAGGTTVAVLGHPGFVFDEMERSHVFQQKLSFLRKDHLIKVGGQLRSSGYELFGGGNPNGSYLVTLSQAQEDQIAASNIGSSLAPEDIPSDVTVNNYGVELRPNAFEKRQQIFSLYAEDQWTLSSRLNVNVGLRWDYDNLSKGGGDEGDFNNIAPRLSANYKINERSSIRAGYGIYYDKVLYAIYSDALQFNSNSADYRQQLQALIEQGILPANTDINAVTNEGNLVANVANATYLDGPSAASLQGQREDVFQNELRILNPNGYDNPFSHQFMLGYQRRVSDELIFYVDGMYNRSFNLFRLRNLNAPGPYPLDDPDNTVVRTTSEADLTRPIPILEDGTGNYALVAGDTLRGIARNVVMTEAKGKSEYLALNFTMQKVRGTDNYAYRLMYTLSRLENNTEDINFRAQDANNFSTEWGPSINDRTHLINGIFNYFPFNNTSFTLAGLLQSGQPINRIPDADRYGGTTDLNGDGRAFGDAYVGNSDRSPGASRNSDRLPWSATFDISLYQTFSVSDQSKIELGAQIFNVFNAENLSGYSNNATQSNQVQPGPESSGVLITRNSAPPRQFQFSLRYLF